VLDYPLDAAGILAAFPYILMAIVVQVNNVILLFLYTVHICSLNFACLNFKDICI
jgi:hypothetical protein